MSIVSAALAEPATASHNDAVNRSRMAVRRRKCLISLGWRLSTSWTRKSPTKRLSPVNCRMKELGLG